MGKVIDDSFSFKNLIDQSAKVIHSLLSNNVDNFKSYTKTNTIYKTTSARYPLVTIRHYNWWIGSHGYAGENHPWSNDQNPASRSYTIKSGANALSDSYSRPNLEQIKNGIYSLMTDNISESNIDDKLTKDTTSLIEVTRAIVMWLNNHIYILTSVIFGEVFCYQNTSSEKIDVSYSHIEDLIYIFKTNSTQKTENFNGLLTSFALYARQNCKYKAIQYSVNWD